MNPGVNVGVNMVDIELARVRLEDFSEGTKDLLPGQVEKL